MDLLVVLLVLMTLWKLEFHKASFDDGYLSVENSTMVKGVLSVIIILHHLYPQSQGGSLGWLFDRVGYLSVAFFFFASGYGLHRSFVTKPRYGRSILTKRIPSVLVPFLTVTVFYWLLDFLEGAPCSVGHVLASFVNGAPVADNTWFALCILVFYLVYLLSTRVCRRGWQMAAFSAGFCVVWAVLCGIMGYSVYWYISCMAFPMGIVWAIGEDRLVPWIKGRYLLSILLCCAAMAVCMAVKVAAPLNTAGDTLYYWLTACLFTALILLALMKCTIRNPLIGWLGKISYETYLTHGLFLRLYRSGWIHIQNDLLWGVAVVVSTVILASALHKLFRKLR